MTGSTHQSATRREGGFTLIELMIVVVIVAVLAAIGYPSYQQYARESKRADAHSALTRIAALQERHFSDNNRYATNALELGYAAATATSPDGYWSVTIANTNPADPMDYQLTAAPAGSHSDAQCPSITLDSAGLRGPVASDCW